MAYVEMKAKRQCGIHIIVLVGSNWLLEIVTINIVRQAVRKLVVYINHH